jgi:uncharacterized membrane protein HdeD (DUF308 family)
MEKKKKVQLKTSEMGESILASIIFLILGIFLITNPTGWIQWIVGILGVIITLIGVFKLLVYYKSKETQEKKDVLTGGVFILLGMASIICALVFMDKVIGALRIILAIYLLYVGIFRLVYAFKAKGSKKPFFINALIIIGVGVLLLLIPGLFDTPLIAIGVLLTVYSIAEIVGFVLGRKNGVGATIAEAVVVSEKDEEVKLLK